VSPFQDVPSAFLALVPLALAAGIDLYLTLLLLGLASHVGWWDALPGALGDLASPPILVIVGGAYVLEALAERWAPAAIVWNAFHAIIRPLSGALLTLLLLDGGTAKSVLLGALLAAAIASGAHAVRTGGWVLLWLDAAKEPNRLLVALLEDVLVLGTVVLTLDHPSWAFSGGCLAIVVSGRMAGSQLRAFMFAVRLLWSRSWTTLGKPRWDDPNAFPQWVRSALETSVMAPGGGLRGSFAGARRLPGARPFVTGWVVICGDTPLFLYRALRRVRKVDLARLSVVGVSQSAFFRRVSLRDATPWHLYFGLGGPGTESLRTEFHNPEPPGTAPPA
jgi:hypothetical protein